MDAATYEIISALCTYGKLDLATAISLQRSCKDTIGLVSEAVLTSAISNTSNTLIWIGKLLDKPLTPSSLKTLRLGLNMGDETLIKDLSQNDEFHFSEDLHKDLLNICFPPNNHIVCTYLHMFLRKFPTWINASHEEKASAFGFMIKVVTRLYEWGIHNYTTVSNDPDTYGVITSDMFRNVLVLKLHELLRSGILNDRPDIQVLAKSLIRMINAWAQTSTTGTRLYLGTRGGLYTLDKQGKKQYFKK